VQITWGPSHLVDWSPKSISRYFMEAEVPKKRATHTYQMQGDTLVDNTGITGPSHRASSGQRVPKHD
jgi:hypothetical protein